MVVGILILTATGAIGSSCDKRAEDCFKIIDIKWDDRDLTKYNIECTKGINAGRKECLLYIKSDGTWGGCSISSGFAKKDRREVGNYICSN